MIGKLIDLNYIDIYYDTVIDGEGIRVSLYLAGCDHNCKKCHNPQSHDPLAGYKLSYEVLGEIKEYIDGNSYISGLTISGGEPFHNPEELLKILEFFKDYQIWCYTGYELDEVLKYEECFKYIDVLVDGRYVDSLKTPELSFRGSSNQRIINIKDL